MSDYKIAHKINTDPPSVIRSRKNAYKKLVEAVTDLEWVREIRRKRIARYEIRKIVGKRVWRRLFANKI